MTKMLPRVQNAIGELCLEIGMTQEGFQYFQKAWFNLLEFSSRNLKDNQDLVKQKGRVGTWRGHHFFWFRVRLLGSYQPWRQGTGHASCVCLIFWWACEGWPWALLLWQAILSACGSLLWHTSHCFEQSGDHWLWSQPFCVQIPPLHLLSFCSYLFIYYFDF